MDTIVNNTRYSSVIKASLGFIGDLANYSSRQIYDNSLDMDSVNNLSSSPDNATSAPNDTSSDKYFEAAVLVPIVWTILILVGLLGNGLVVYVLLRYGERKATNCYIVNLALTDLAFILVAVPFTMTYYVMPSWIFGISMCRIHMYMIYVTLQATCLTLTAMTIDRYFVIVHPIRSMEFRTPKLALLVSVAIWFVSFVGCIPFALYHGLKYDSSDPTAIYCRDTWPSNAAEKFATVFVVTVTYFIPFAIIIVCYTLMIRHLWRQAATTSGTSNYGPQHVGSALQKLQMRKRRKATKMVAVVAILFVTLWLPIHVFHVWFKFDDDFPKTRITFDFKIIAHSLSYASSVVNPFVYSFLGDGFQKATRKAFPFFFRRKQIRPASQAMQGADRGTPSTTMLLAANIEQLFGPALTSRQNVLIPRTPSIAERSPGVGRIGSPNTLPVSTPESCAASRNTLSPSVWAYRREDVINQSATEPSPSTSKLDLSAVMVVDPDQGTSL